jgi:hypothetical protein
MANQITDVQRVEYENRVKHAYQSLGSNLDSTVRVQNITGAGNFKFRNFGKLKMVPRGQTKSRLEAQATVNTLIDCSATDYVLPILTDIFDQSKTNAPNEQQESALAIALAMRRQRDQSVITALDAATMATGHTITAGSGLTVAKLIEGMEVFDANEIRNNDPLGDGTITCLITEKEHTDLLSDALTQSIDTSNFKSLVTGQVGDFMGYKFIMIGSGRAEGGLTLTGSTRECYAYVKSSMGQCVNVEPRVESTYLHEYTSDFVNGILSLGSVAVDTGGIVKFNVTE